MTPLFDPHSSNMYDEYALPIYGTPYECVPHPSPLAPPPHPSDVYAHE
eukprot:CAMPEP_0118799064 /NCGR_PEP_ID=MMETSP1161-20130426/1351_1 /TAXON_ID=249345 /ORGANISM="Picochlorum oklahomensis, Strain CCMP2329" /LENGTH=47 /DNA_ID= /DNA_START= /DNA_END= /DNA_ORIENTATION=